MIKKLKLHTFRYFILIVVFFALLGSTNFLKKIYFINKYEYVERIGKNYSFCKNGSIPFLHYLKTKYNLDKNIKIVDYDINPNSEWVVFSSNKGNIYEDKLILLNYRPQERIKFLKSDKGLYAAYVLPPHNFTIKQAIFSANSSVNNINFEITNRVGNVTEVLYSENFEFNNRFNKIDFDLDLEKFDIRLGKLFIKIFSSENSLENVEEITLKIIPNYNLDNFKVLERKNNCYFLEKLN